MELERGALARSTATMKQVPLLSWADCAPRLVAVAAGRAAADLVITGGTLVNVQSRELLPGWQLAVAEGRFAYVGPDASHCIGPHTKVANAEGKFLIPGLCDGRAEPGELVQDCGLDWELCDLTVEVSGAHALPR